MVEKHTFMGGEAYVHGGENSSVSQCSSHLVGRDRSVSVKEESLAKAKEFAEDWYLELRAETMCKPGIMAANPQIGH